MSDNEHALPPLRQVTVLSVKNAVGEPVPEFCQRPEDGSKRPSSVIRQDSGDVLPSQPAGAKASSQGKVFKGEVAARVIQSCSFSGDAERLARCSSDQNIDWLNGHVLSDPGKVAVIWHVGVVMGQDRRRERLYLRNPRALPSERRPSH
jgi:hypothetical protein